MGKLVAAGLSGVFLLLISFALMAGSSGVHLASASPPTGGCTVRVSSGGGSASGGSFPDMPQKSAELDAEQMAAARTVVAVGKAMGITERGVAIALGTAMQESSLRPHNTDGYGVGLYMQQGALYADVDKRDPAAAARAFYEQLLKQVPHYADADAVPFAVAAQTVQASGAGAKYYARWREWALALAESLYSGTQPAEGGAAAGQVRCQVGGGSGPIRVRTRGLTVFLPERANVDGKLTFPHPAAATAAAAALSYLGTPYAWGGGGPNGPTEGIPPDAGVVGFDCSGLTEYAYAQAGVNLPSVSQTQQRVPVSLPWSEAKPGDLLFWGYPAHHVALYLGTIDGGHYMVEAPFSGGHVRVRPVRTGGDFQYTVVRPYAAQGGGN